MNPDVMQIAVQYRDELQSELARLDAFIEEADRLTRLSEEDDSGLLLPGQSEEDATVH